MLLLLRRRSSTYTLILTFFHPVLKKNDYFLELPRRQQLKGLPLTEMADAQDIIIGPK